MGKAVQPDQADLVDQEDQVVIEVQPDLEDQADPKE